MTTVTDSHVAPEESMDLAAPRATGAHTSPLVKWAGGKSQLLGEIIPRVPEDFGTYHEPFLGGGAVYFGLLPTRAHICDLNRGLVNVYRVVRDCPGEFLGLARELEADYNAASLEAQEQKYYELRNRFNEEPPLTVRHAVLFVFLNKAGFNGLYRENRAGKFNVPWGKRSSVALASPDNTYRVSAALGVADLNHGSFEMVLDHAKSGDFVYFDPPYVPVEGSPSFTSYQATGFSLQDQQRLAEVVSALADRGVKVMLSNSDTAVVRDLYGSWNYEVVMARRNINSRGGGRGTVAEALVRTYE